MAKRYQHRIGVRAEICFDVILDVQNPAPDELCQATADALGHAADIDNGFALKALPGGVVFPDWNSVDGEVEPNRVLEPATIRSLDCVEVESLQ